MMRWKLRAQNRGRFACGRGPQRDLVATRPHRAIFTDIIDNKENAKTSLKMPVLARWRTRIPVGAAEIYARIGCRCAWQRSRALRPLDSRRATGLLTRTAS